MGNCYLLIHYGSKIISPSPDKGAIAIAIGNKINFVGTIEAVIAAAQSGELDNAIKSKKAIDKDSGIRRKVA